MAEKIIRGALLVLGIGIGGGKLIQFLTPANYQWLAGMILLGLGSGAMALMPKPRMSHELEMAATWERYKENYSNWGGRMLLGVTAGLAGAIIFFGL